MAAYSERAKQINTAQCRLKPHQANWSTALSTTEMIVERKCSSTDKSMSSKYLLLVLN